MEICKAYWQIFALTGNVEAYLLYRGVFQEEKYVPVASTSEILE